MAGQLRVPPPPPQVKIPRGILAEGTAASLSFTRGSAGAGCARGPGVGGGRLPRDLTPPSPPSLCLMTHLQICRGTRRAAEGDTRVGRGHSARAALPVTARAGPKRRMASRGVGHRRSPEPRGHGGRDIQLTQRGDRRQAGGPCPCFSPVPDTQGLRGGGAGLNPPLGSHQASA